MFHLGSFGLWEPDEARYAEIAREMLQSGNLLVPHLNYVAYVEKPPLLYWLTTLSFWIFGVSEFAARLPVALSAIAGIIATYFFALRAFGRRHAILAAAILATTPLYALMAQVLTTDMTLTALVTIATFALYLHWHEGGRWCWIAYVAMALAVMTKGPVGAAMPILSDADLAGVTCVELRGAIAKFRAIPGLLLMLLIAAPWFVAMTIREPGFADFYFVGEHLRRAFDSDYSHSEAFYFYIPVIAVGLLPWSLLVPFLTWREAPRNPARSFCLVAAGVTVIAFSCSSAKLIPYILPAIPPIAVLIADGLVVMRVARGRFACGAPAARFANSHRERPDARAVGCGRDRRGDRGAAISHSVRDGSAACDVCDRRDPVGRRRGHDAMFHDAAHGCGTRRDRRHARACANRGRMGRGSKPSRCVRTPSLSRAIAEKAPDADIICYHRYVQSLPFYNRKRIVLLGGRTELDFGSRLDPDARDWFMNNDDQMFRRWERPGPIVVVLDAGDLARMKERFGDFDLIAAEGKKRAIMRRERISRREPITLN